MTLPRGAVTAALIGAAMALSACGNDANTAQPLQILGQAGKSLFGGNATAPTQVSAQQIATALAATDQPVLKVGLTDLKTQALTLRIESNGAYDTYATSARQTITTRGGLVTATRGIGGDLMSSDPSALLTQIRSGQAGQVPYTMRFLRGDDVTVAYKYSCAITPAGETRVAAGEVNVSGRVTTARCTGDGPAFDARFVSDSDGFIVRSQQWLGTYIGTVVAEFLRT